MKLKYTTKLFIAVNIIAVAIRTVQILVFTENETAFLKDGTLAVNIIFAVLILLVLSAMFFNASQAVRQPEKINCRGIPSAVAAGLCGVAFLSDGVLAFINSGKTIYGGVSFAAVLYAAVAGLACVSCIMMMGSALKDRPLSKPAALSFIAYWIMQFINAYLFYTERPLRVRTVYEAFALCFVIVFVITYGKAVSGVKPDKSFRRIYPLGLTACSLCILSVVPELIAAIFGFGEKVTESAVTTLTLAAGAIFTGFFTINTFKKSNTIHPKAKKRLEVQAAVERGEFEDIQSSSNISEHKES